MSLKELNEITEKTLVQNAVLMKQIETISKNLSNMKHLETTHKTLKRQRKAAAQKNKELVKTLKTLNTEVQKQMKIHEKCDAERQKIADFNGNMEEIREEISSLQSRLWIPKELKLEHDNVKQERKILEKKSAVLTKELQKLQKKVDQQRLTEINFYQDVDHFHALDAETEDLREKVKELQTEISGRDQVREQYPTMVGKNDLEELFVLNNSLTKQLRKHTRQSGELQTLRDEVARRIQEVEESAPRKKEAKPKKKVCFQIDFLKTSNDEESNNSKKGIDSNKKDSESSLTHESHEEHEEDEDGCEGFDANFFFGEDLDEKCSDFSLTLKNQEERKEEEDIPSDEELQNNSDDEELEDNNPDEDVRSIQSEAGAESNQEDSDSSSPDENPEKSEEVEDGCESFDADDVFGEDLDEKRSDFSSTLKNQEERKEEEDIPSDEELQNNSNDEELEDNNPDEDVRSIQSEAGAESNQEDSDPSSPDENPEESEEDEDGCEGFKASDFF